MLCCVTDNRTEQKEKGRGMEVGQMQRQWLDNIKSFFIEGFLDSQFLQLQQLQDENNPEFVVEVQDENNPEFVVEVAFNFFEDSERLLKDLTFALDQESIDYKKVDAHVHQLKGSSSSVGAQRFKNCCIAFRNFCEEQNTDACLKLLQEAKQEYCLIKNKLETLFRLEEQIVAAGGSIPMMELDF